MVDDVVRTLSAAEAAVSVGVPEPGAKVWVKTLPESAPRTLKVWPPPTTVSPDCTTVPVAVTGPPKSVTTTN